jgi:large subunit ribosomal protein L18
MTQKRMTPAKRRKLGTRAKLRRVNILQNPNRAIRPRLSVHRTNKQIYAQIIDDVKGVTLASASSMKLKAGHSVDAATQVGKEIAKAAKDAGVKKVQFDRGQFLYHGRVKALAEAAREGGVEF